MKKFLILILFVLLLSGCKKNPTEPDTIEKLYLTKLAGHWACVEKVGGIAGIHRRYNDSSGEKISLTFNSNKTYVKMDSGITIKRNYIEDGIFTLTEDSVNIFNSKCMSITFNVTDTNNCAMANYNYHYNLLFKSIDGDTLRLYQNYYDGFSFVYVRQN